MNGLIIVVVIVAVLPAPLMTTMAELGTFLARETAAASPSPPGLAGPVLAPVNGAARG